MVAAAAMRDHAMWRDELQAWCLARDSNSFLMLIRNARHEGHPLLWHTLLFGLTRATTRPEAMQALHLAIGAASAWILLKYAPFPLAYRVAMVLGYYWWFEYTVISRNYGIAMLLISAALVVRHTMRPRILLACWLLALAMQTHLLAAIIAAVLGVIIIVEHALDWRAVGIVLFGLILSALQIVPPSDQTIYANNFTTLDTDRLVSVLSRPLEAYFPFPTLGVHFWNTTFVEKCLPAQLTVPFSLAVVVLFAIGLRRCRTALAFYLISTIALEWIFYVKISGPYARYSGFLFAVLIYAYWMARDRNNVERSPTRPMPLLLSAILILQVLASGAAFWLSGRYPFSGAKAVANYLERNHLQDYPLCGARSPNTSPIAGYLNRRLYYLVDRRHGTFIVWNSDPQEKLNEQTVIDSARAAARSLHHDAILIRSHVQGEAAYSQAEGFKLLYSSPPSTVPDEQFYVYLVRSSST